MDRWHLISHTEVLTDLDKTYYALCTLQIIQECVRNVCKCTGHAFPARLMLRESPQLLLVVEIERFENLAGSDASELQLDIRQNPYFTVGKPEFCSNREPFRPP